MILVMQEPQALVALSPGDGRLNAAVRQVEREAFRRQAAAKKMSLSNWLREAGLKQLEAEQDRPIRTVTDLREFFASLPQEHGVEPDWDEHLDVVAEARRRGTSPS